MAKKGTLLVVDDNRNILSSVKMLMDGTFAKVITIANPAEIPASLREHKPDVILLDMNFRNGINNGNEGIFWLREIKKVQPSAQVVLFTAYADIELAVNGIKEGATDFIVKPFDNAKMMQTLTGAYDKCHKDNSKPTIPYVPMYWGESEAMGKLRSLVEKVAPTDATILITGENGTGKEMLANEIHRLSPRGGIPMIPIDMGAITPTLFESELFGHVKGAFTDAHEDKIGKFQAAENGTLFMDEIGNLPFDLQAKLLTAIQRKSIVRVGDTKPIPMNVRMIFATNKHLDEMVKDGEFREDLLYRINTIQMHLPALRDRKEDIVPLAELFLKKYGEIYSKPNFALSDDAKAKLIEHPWPGNIRELEHVIEKTVILCDGETILAEDIECTPNETLNLVQTGNETIDQMEKKLIAKTIEGCAGNLSLVANRLGITRQTLYNKIKKYGL
jgi:two-component system, NtrC family, response regulator HydG